MEISNQSGKIILGAWDSKFFDYFNFTQQIRQTIIKPCRIIPSQSLTDRQCNIFGPNRKELLIVHCDDRILRRIEFHSDFPPERLVSDIGYGWYGIGKFRGIGGRWDRIYINTSLHCVGTFGLHICLPCLQVVSCKCLGHSPGNANRKQPPGGVAILSPMVKALP